MIVLNGEPFLRYNIRALYPFAHEIIIVEGACPGAKDIAKTDGHSRDGTIGVIRNMQRLEDPQRKIKLVTAEDEGHPNGFWSEKDEMSQAYARRATGNYLWQVDVDEFYLPEDMKKIINLLQQNPQITAVSFLPRSFWGGLSYQLNSAQMLLDYPEVPRLFAWKPEYSYVSHREPTVVDEKYRSLRSLKPVTGRELAKKHGIYLYHYEYLFAKQVLEKCSYFANATWTGGAYENALVWARECFMDIQHPYRLHLNTGVFHWLEAYSGAHPQQVKLMMEAVRRHEHSGVQLRKTADIEKLLNSSSYRLGRVVLKPLLKLEKQLKNILGFSEGISLSTSVEQNIHYLASQLRQKLMPDQTSLQPITRLAIRPPLFSSWHDTNAPYLQRELINHMLKQMYQGKQIMEFKVLADAVKATKSLSPRIIEVGCATGHNYEVLCHLLGHQIKYLGVDIARGMVALAHKYYPQEPFMIGDACNLALENGSCDIAILSSLIQHLAHPEKAIAEAFRISNEWVVLHQVPVTRDRTSYFIRKAYGILFLHTQFNEQDLMRMISEQGLIPFRTYEAGEGYKTFVCKKP